MTVGAGPELSEAEITAILDVALQSAGLSFPESKRKLIEPRVLRALKKAGVEDVHDFLAKAEARNGRERQRLLPALTTNFTTFFRELHHFEDLADTVCPALASRAEGEKIRVWSAGCANGAEAYSAAITLAKHVPGLANYDCKILATDLDPGSVAAATEGVYPVGAVSTLPRQDRMRFFDDVGDGEVRVAETVRGLLRARVLNIHDPWPMSCRFDVIFFRNVSIYFHPAWSDRLWPRIIAALRPGGTLYIGHAERLPADYAGIMPRVGKTTYRKSEAV